MLVAILVLTVLDRLLQRRIYLLAYPFLSYFIPNSADLACPLPGLGQCIDSRKIYGILEPQTQ